MTRSLLRRALILFAAAAPALGAPATVRLASLPIPGEPAFVETARDVLDAVFSLDPAIAANAGLFDDAVRVPSFSPASVRKLARRLEADLAAMRAMPWRSWPVDRQIDFRWIYAGGETALRQLTVERPWRHRPASWLEPLSGTLIAFASFAPDGSGRQTRLWALVPGMLREMRGLASEVTERDRQTARRLVTALAEAARRERSTAGRAAAAALEGCDAWLAALRPRREFVVIGADNYAWRLKRALLLDLTPQQLLDAAGKELARVDGEIASLQGELRGVPPAEPTVAQRARAAGLTCEGFLALHDAIESALREETVRAGFVTVPESVGPIRARETPEAMIPLTGDGGSMNPPPPLGGGNVGFWNVERFQPGWSEEGRLGKIVRAEGWRRGGTGPYAAHEGFPGHHLQLSIARLHSNPIRSILPDAVQNEGWALYAEEELWRHGGLDGGPEARAAILRSYRFRIARVIYDVNIETGIWDLQRGADFKDRAEPGKGKVDENLLRAIQWPTQLASYFIGKREIVALREEYRQKVGAAYDDRRFHDAFLAEGSIPVRLIRAKLLGEPVPGI